MSEPVAARELMARAYTAAAPTRCQQHGHLPLARRPGCSACSVEMLSQLDELAKLVEWLQSWRDDALDVLARQEAAIGVTVGWETRRYKHGLGADLVRPGLDGDDILVDDIHHEKAAHLEQWLCQIADVAEGLVATIELEGGARGPRQAST